MSNNIGTIQRRISAIIEEFRRSRNTWDEINSHAFPLVNDLTNSVIHSRYVDEPQYWHPALTLDFPNIAEKFDSKINTIIEDQNTKLIDLVEKMAKQCNKMQNQLNDLYTIYNNAKVLHGDQFVNAQAIFQTCPIITYLNRMQVIVDMYKKELNTKQSCVSSKGFKGLLNREEGIALLSIWINQPSIVKATVQEWDDICTTEMELQQHVMLATLQKWSPFRPVSCYLRTVTLPHARLLNASRKHIYTTSQPRLTSDPWSSWEDELLSNYVKYNGKKWGVFVQHCLPTRTAKQCQMRWMDVLNPALKKGPFSQAEKTTLEQAVKTLGEGSWKTISAKYLPQRSPRQIANEWRRSPLSIKDHVMRNNWTEDEDKLILKGFDELGRSWTKIATQYLPWRTSLQIYNRFRTRLDPAMKRNKWSDEELSLLLRRTIILGQDWNKVAEGIEHRTGEQCRIAWQTELDPSLKKGRWSDEETRLFWTRLYEFRGSFVKTAEGLPGRNRVLCARKFWETVLHDKEFNILYGDVIKQDDPTENQDAWRASVAKCALSWLNEDMNICMTSNKSIQFRQLGSWSQSELEQLKLLVNEWKSKSSNKSVPCGDDWKEIAEKIEGRDRHQCKYQYEYSLLEKDLKKGRWSEDEDQLLESLVNEHGPGNWDIIMSKMPQRTKQQCMYRWSHYLKLENNIIKRSRLTDEERRLIREGVDMFGYNWKAIHMTYLPHRTPQQIMNGWKSEERRIQIEGNRRPWTEDEDAVLRYAVSKCNEDQISWAKIAELVEGRSSKQCQLRWAYSLKPDIKKGRWSYDEELQLIEAVGKYKSQQNGKNIWPLVANELATGRTDKSCRAKYNYMQRKGHRFIF
ncbi:MAG: Homeodomain-like protein [Benjaminiella poitrasii]|nr:MAG: Homeodomain-like protein [Benjaminiella poitrasii]